MAELYDVTDESFEREVVANPLPVLVDFWGDHCPACRQISPILDQLAEQRAGTLKVVKIHAAENAATAARYGIRAMPTVLLFSGGVVRGQLVGARPMRAFVDLLSQV